MAVLLSFSSLDDARISAGAPADPLIVDTRREHYELRVAMLANRFFCSNKSGQRRSSH